MSKFILFHKTFHFIRIFVSDIIVNVVTILELRQKKAIVLKDVLEPQEWINVVHLHITLYLGQDCK